MADVDRLLDEFVAEHRAGGDPDPRRFLDRVTGTDRAELAALIDAYLERSPGRAWDADEFATSAARDVADALTRSLTGVSGAWPVLLPRLRTRARLRRDEVVHRLAEALGVAGHEDRVAAYYHRMELGSLPAGGVSGRVLEALGEIVGTGAAALRRAGAAIEPGARGEAADAVFARVAAGDGEQDDGPPAGGPEERPRAGTTELDEVDELFTGG